MVVEGTGKRKSGPIMPAKPKKVKFKHRAAGKKEEEEDDNTAVTATTLIDTQLQQLIGEARRGQPKRSAAKRCVKEIRYALSAQAAADVGVEALKGAAFHPITVHDKATRLAWEPPQEVEFIGSIASGTAVSSGEVLDGTYTNTRGQVQNVDIALQMPRSCFLAKDHLNHKYSDKRALYLAVVLRVLRGTQRFAHAKVGYLLPGDTSKPIITVGPHTTRLQSAGDDDEGRESGLPFQLRIIPHPGPDGLAGIRKLLPSRNCNRGRRQPGGGDEGKSTQPPTPTYNNRLLEDLHLTTLSAEICTCIERNPNLGQAMTIAKVWLLQRRLHIAIGGVRPYQMCLLMCFLAGSSNGQGGVILNEQMSPWQMIRATMLYLAQKSDAAALSSSTHPLRLRGAAMGGAVPQDEMAHFLAAWDVVLLDSTGMFNVFASVSESGFTELIWHAHLSLGVINSIQPHEQLERLFFTPLSPAYKYDMHVVVTVDQPKDFDPVSAGLQDDVDTGIPEWGDAVQRHAESVAVLALGGRAALVRTVSATVGDIDTGDSAAAEEDAAILSAGIGEKHKAVKLSSQKRKTLRWVVGVHLKAGAAQQIVEKGPAVSLGNEGELSEFRRFWGNKAEVRRMKDGSIIEAVVWSNCASSERRHLLIGQILNHALTQHLKPLAARGSVKVSVTDGTPLDGVLFRNERCSERQWTTASDSFGKLSKRIRNCRGDGGVNGLPLAITRVVATSARLRRCSALPPRPHTMIPGCNVSRAQAEPALTSRPMGVVIEFEGSGSWPSDDMLALRAIKSAMLVRLSQTLQTKFKIASQATLKYLDIFADGYVFRVSVSHNRELSLIEEDITTLERVVKATDKQKPYLLARVPRGLTQAALPALRAELKSLQQSYVFEPLHASSVSAMLLGHAPLGMAIRMAKAWCAAHMFSGHLTPQAIELIVCYCFTPRGAFPYAIPVSHVQGFARFLHTLATHDWKTVPLVVDLDAQQTPLSTEDVETAWSSRRATAPASSGDGTASTETCKEALEVFIASSYDLDVSVWTTPAQPSATALRRMQVFASASASRICSYLDGTDVSDSVCSVFVTPLTSYDVLLHLKPELVSGGVDALDPAQAVISTNALNAGPLALPAPRPKNLAGSNRTHDQVLCGFDPVALFVEELRESFGHIATFYHNAISGHVVAMTWLLEACVPHRGRSSLQLQMLSDAMIVGGVVRGSVEDDDDRVDDKEAPKLLLRNTFEMLERIRRLGNGLIERVQFVPSPGQGPSPQLLHSLQSGGS